MAQEMVVRKRNQRVATFDPSLIERAITSAFRAEIGIPQDQSVDPGLAQEISHLTETVVEHIAEQAMTQEGVGVEQIQDVVEMRLMSRGHYKVARRYIVYREEHTRARALRADTASNASESPRLDVQYNDGSRKPLEPNRIRNRLKMSCRGLEGCCSIEELQQETSRALYNGITPDEIEKAMILAARSRIENDPAYRTVAARLLLQVIYREALGRVSDLYNIDSIYREQFHSYIKEGVSVGRLSPELLEFDVESMAESLHPKRDLLFQYLGLQILYDRYLIHIDHRRIETPQYFWMRVAMGLAVEEEDKEKRAMEFYNILSTMRFTSATPTLFNSGTLHPQLSSCYLSTTKDDLEHIFKVVSDNAKLSKWAGGLGNDWTNVRATNAYIRGTNGKSQGVIPFLKIVNDTAVAVNQGGKRKGAVCAYLEPWHMDFEEFLELRKNTGDERRRTHDMHTANWIPDLFMKRVQQDAEWTLFSPNDTPDLHDLYGKNFENRYMEYEERALAGDIQLFKRVSAVELWRKMLTRLFETGHPWITFKDPSNIRSPQDHAGVVHSSNLCTEILLNTSEQETAVCNLGSVNLRDHIQEGKLDLDRLENTVRTAVRMLDNVIDINYYPTPESRNSNERHRPVGLGVMGFQDALYKLGYSFASQEAVDFADHSMEAISYFAILGSSELAQERGPYATYKGSKWDRGLLPIDTIDLLQTIRGVPLEMNRTTTLDWAQVRQSVKAHGMRNSNVMAIAPTATIANIIGVGQSIEPTYKNLYTKSNLSGEFTQVNSYLVEDLKCLDLWDQRILDELKYYDGSLQEIERIPVEIKEKYLSAFEVEPRWLIECASRRQKWIDMGQSLNLYIAQPSGKKLHEMYFMAWKMGLKTTYYLRSLAATQVEKSTLDINKYGIQPRWMKNKSASSNVQVDREHQDQTAEVAVTCNLEDGECEACQ